MSRLSACLKAIRQAPALAGLGEMTRGIEKESLRVCAAGSLSASPHPEGLGAALTHPQITTDFSEALLEFITPPSRDINELLSTLEHLHHFTYQHIGNERLWVNSMPCVLGTDDDIPIAHYGRSHIAKMKSVYRLGLGQRYGRSMQTIAGIHFNFSVSDKLWQFLREQEQSSLSLSDFKTQGYFKLIRNFRRYFWLLLYLFGASPAVCRSFIKGGLDTVGKDSGAEHTLLPLGEKSLYNPYATSLRMGDLGYQSSAQESLVVTYNCLASYIESLCQAITRVHPHYRELGLFDAQGQRQQLNDCLLQIENEFYSVIRPKRTSESGQTALNALVSGGVEYIEVRCLDVNPFEPLGINAEQIRFLDCFLLFCLLEDSPLADATEAKQLQENQARMVYQGRDPELTLFHFGKRRKAREWGQEMLSKIADIADVLDGDLDGDKESKESKESKGKYRAALKAQQDKIKQPSLTPSAQIIEAIKSSKDNSFYHWATQQALNHREQFLKQTLDSETRDFYEKMAQASHQQQAAIEQADTGSFEEFIAEYYRQYQCLEDAPV